MIRFPRRFLDDRTLLLRNLSEIFSDASFTSVLARYIRPENTEAPNFFNSDIERLLHNYKIENGDCFDRLFKFNKEMIKKLFDRRYTLKELKSSLRSVIPSLYSDTLTLDDFMNSIKKNPDRVQYFLEKGMYYKDARACALALSFYTGLPEANIQGEILERMNRNVRFNHLANENATSPHYMVIISFLYRALSQIPNYSGSCIRAVDLSDEEKCLYEPGSLVNWRNFSSSSQGAEPAMPFRGKNTHFIIQSITGKSIVRFSNFAGENEILFHPCSTFFVLKKEIQDDKTLIYLRQTELGMSDNTILWVDDQIFSENWEHKPFYDKLSGYAHQHGVRVIPKSSTAQAQSFLESPFGRYNLENSKNFQVITNMRRPNEKQGSKAGLVFANWLKEKKYSLDLAMFDPKASVGNYASVRNLSELGHFIHDRIGINYMFWNCPINDDFTLNPNDEETPLPEQNEDNENQTPDGDIGIASTPEAVETSHHHISTPEAAEILHHYQQTPIGENSTPGDSFNNFSTTPTPAGFDAFVGTPGLADCSQEASKFLAFDEEGQQKFEGEHDSHANNYNSVC